MQTDRSLSEALVSTVAGVVGMVPQGLVLLVSMASAVAVIRLGQRNALVQELPAVETLARVDIVCVDKTGTLTTGVIRHRATVMLGDRDPVDLAGAVAAIAAADPHPNPTMRGVAEAYPDDPGWTVERFVPFSSDRKFSAVRFADGCSWVIGAPEIVLEGGEPDLADTTRSSGVDRAEGPPRGGNRRADPGRRRHAAGSARAGRLPDIRRRDPVRRIRHGRLLHRAERVAEGDLG